GVAAIDLSHTRKSIEKMQNIEFAASAHARGQMHDGEGTERAVVHHVRIGDRQDDTEAWAVFFHELAFEVNDVGRAVRLLLRVHAVIGGDADDSAELKQAAKPLVDRGIEIERIRFLRPELMLDVIGGGEIKK